MSQTSEQRKESYEKSRAMRDKVKSLRVPFISSQFYPGFWLCQGLILVGAMSGRSKSTTAANIIYGFLNEFPDKRVIVISNEENTDAIFDRVSCLRLNISFGDYFKGRVSPRAQEDVRQESLALTANIEVVDDPSWNTSCIEDVKAVLNHASKNVDLVIIDYFQSITTSRNEPNAEPWQVCKSFGHYIKDYGRQNGVPVVALCQLNPGAEGHQFQERVQNDKTIFNHAFTVIEIEPDFETNLTTFTIHKDRFLQSTGVEVVVAYDRGKYVFAGGKGGI